MKVIKRDGHIVDYMPEKIENAILKANAEVAEEEQVTESEEIIIHKDSTEKDVSNFSYYKFIF